MKVQIGTGARAQVVEFSDISQVVIMDDLGHPISAAFEQLADAQSSHILVVNRDDRECADVLRTYGYGRRVCAKGDLKLACQSEPSRS